MRYVNMLHLSDLHLKPEGGAERYNQDLIVDAAERAISKLTDGQFRPDVLIFSGDLVNAADDNIFAQGRGVLERLMSAASLSFDRVIIAPGNHDSSRNAIGPAIPAINLFREQADTVNGANELIFNTRFISHVGNVFGSFNSLYRLYGHSMEVFGDFISRAYYFPDLGLGIVSTNTSTLTGAGLTNDLKDKDRLFSAEISIDRALKALPESCTKVVVGHHPLHFLNEANSSITRVLLQKEATAYLSGHVHKTIPEFKSAPQGGTSFIQAGALYTDRGAWNGFSLISIDPLAPESPRILYKKWQEDRREFGVATELADDGIVYLGDRAKSHWAKVRPRLSPFVWEGWRRETLQPFIQKECAKDLSKVFEEGRFVDPDFERDRYVKAGDTIERAAHPDFLTFQEIIDANDNIVIMATPESGKTTMLREWARRATSVAATDANWRIPVFIKFSELRSYLNQVERLIKQRLPDLPPGVTFDDALASGKLILLVDDVNLASVKEQGGLADFIREHNKNRFVLLTSSVYLQGAGIAPDIVKGVAFSHIRAKTLRTSQVLALIESHGMKDPTQADRLLQRMMVEASSLNVPITPVTGSFLIQIYTEDSSTSLVNKANLIERYIEISLEKFAPAELLPSSFDFRNKTDLLSFLAQKMAERGNYTGTEAEFVSWVNEYLAEYGLRFSTLDLVEYFVQARILERNDGTISFRLNAFFEYFCAVRMAEDNDFREFVLSENNYLSFANEISFYAAISRKDLSWISTLLERFKETENRSRSEEGIKADASLILEKFTLPSSKDSVEEIRQIEQKAFKSVLTEEDRRDALDDDLPQPEHRTKPTVRPSFDDPGHRWIAQLTMLSAMLKNMELIPTKKKGEILDVVVEAWLEFIAMSLRMVPGLISERRLKFAGVEYVVLYPDDMDPGELAQRLYMYMPIASAKVVSYHLGTEKLRVQLEDGISGVSRQTPASQFLRGAVLAQLGVDGLPEILESVAKSLKDSRYLQEVLFRLLAEVVVRYRLPERERLKISSLAADMRVNLEGATGSKASQRKGSVMKALDSSRIAINYVAKQSKMGSEDRKAALPEKKDPTN